MSPADRGDSEVSENYSSLFYSKNDRFTPLVTFEDDSVSCASIASQDEENTPPASTHTKESAPLKRVVQLVKLGRNQLSNYYGNLGSIPTASWFYTMEKVLMDLSVLLRSIKDDYKSGQLVLSRNDRKTLSLGYFLIKRLDISLKDIINLNN
ncbi:hypothetical protein M378DRAFT_18604 [Amanita muscaria Koide BX008]|uniref:Uncharacterized protein n=1 Tax=Amanita muscaria (strain Koide BX008) TaxID=946122 RepID=A0A0C2WF47_AMAMK|nr:hypothetical protein M378DRAFT_18604 [Amanita muscaria Koide BX008]